MSYNKSLSLIYFIFIGIYSAMYKIDGYWEAAVWHGECSLVLCDLEGGMQGRERQQGRDICMHMADPVHCATETNNTEKLPCAKKCFKAYLVYM